MSIVAAQLALKTPIGNPTAKAILVVYAIHANTESMEAWPTNKTLMEETELGERTIRLWVGWLVEQGYLLPTGTETRSRKYRVNIDRMKGAGAAPFEEEADPKGAPAAPIEDPKGAPAAPMPDLKGAGAAPQGAGAAPQGAGAAPQGARGAPRKGSEKEIKESLKAAEEEEEAPAVAPAGSWVMDAAGAARIYTDVTGMVSIPGSLDEQNLVLGKILDMAHKHGAGLADYLRPFYQALTLAKTKDGRAYSRTNHCWITEWAIAEILPDYLVAQLRLRKPDELPPELAKWMLQLNAPTNGSGKSRSSRAKPSPETIALAERAGWIKPKGATIP